MAKKIKKTTTTVTTTVTTETVSELKTRIAIILDSSGSMSTIQREAVDMFNEQVRAIKKGAKELDTKVSLVTFASQANPPLFFNTDVSKLKELDYNQYVPEGGTAMYDAIGQTVDALKALTEATDPNTSFLIVIISDGQENSSRSYSASAIAERVKSLQDTKRWTFSYLGANQDLTKVTQQLGIYAGNTQVFTANAAGVAQGSVLNSNSTANYMNLRSRGIGATMDFYNPNDGDGSGGASGAQGAGGTNAGGTLLVPGGAGGENGGTSGSKTTK